MSVQLSSLGQLSSPRIVTSDRGHAPRRGVWSRTAVIDEQITNTHKDEQYECIHRLTKHQQINSG